NHHATPGVHPVVSDEPWHFADKRPKAFIHPPPCLTRIGHTLVPAYRCIHIEPPFQCFRLGVGQTTLLRDFSGSRNVRVTRDQKECLVKASERLPKKRPSLFGVNERSWPKPRPIHLEDPDESRQKPRF